MWPHMRRSTCILALLLALPFAASAPLNLTRKPVVWKDFEGVVTYPTGRNQSYPLVIFQHVGGPIPASMGNWTQVYQSIIDPVAGAGYVVCSGEQDNVTFAMKSLSEHMKQCLEYLMKEPTDMKGIVDKAAPTGVYGHSMGGGATIAWAGEEDIIEGFRIGAAVAMHPWMNSGGEPIQIGERIPQIPILYLTGSIDHHFMNCCGPNATVNAFQQVPESVPRALAVIQGLDHFHAANNTEMHWVAPMFDCYLKNKTEGCQIIFSSMCESSVVTTCEAHPQA